MGTDSKGVLTAEVGLDTAGVTGTDKEKAETDEGDAEPVEGGPDFVAVTDDRGPQTDGGGPDFSRETAGGHGVRGGGLDP